MKKFLIVFLVLFAFISVIQAQKMQIGPKAGLNIANVGGSDADNLVDEEIDISLDSRTGFAGGIFFMYQFNKMFAIQPEAYYTMKGATYSEDGGELTLSLDYIEVPLLLKLFIPIEGSNVRPSVFAGPSVGFNTTSKVKAEYDGETILDLDLKDETTSTEFCLVFGGGLGFGVGNNEVGVEIRYILGLNSFDDAPEDPIDVTNNVLNFNAYFGFSL
jgi:hypothetical protein